MITNMIRFPSKSKHLFILYTPNSKHIYKEYICLEFGWSIEYKLFGVFGLSKNSAGKRLLPPCLDCFGIVWSGVWTTQKKGVWTGVWTV